MFPEDLRNLKGYIQQALDKFGKKLESVQLSVDNLTRGRAAPNTPQGNRALLMTPQTPASIPEEEVDITEINIQRLLTIDDFNAFNDAVGADLSLIKRIVSANSL